MKIYHSFPFPAIIILLVAFSLNGFPQKSRTKPAPGPVNNSTSRTVLLPSHDFASSWRQVDSLAGLGLPKSALEIVESIYTRAKTGKNDPQMIKAIIYRIRLNSDFQEDFLATTIAALKQEIATAAVPAKQVLQSILAEVYWKFYQNNQYRFRDRTQVKSNLPDSLETWDLTTLSRVITRTYLRSLDNADTLRHIPIGKFDAILEAELFDDAKKDTLTLTASRFVPTLFDFLAGRALDYFTSGLAGKSMAANHFEVDQQWFFAPTFNFAMNRMMIPADSSAPASFALQIFRNLAAFHLNDPDPRALIDTELKRFAFVHENYTLAGKDSLYPDALKKFEEAEIKNPWSSSISYALASHLFSQGQLYQPLVSDNHKWDDRAALAVCENAVKRFPAAEGSKNCKILAKTIKEPFLQVTTESAVPTDKPSLALVGVKTLKQLFFRLVKADPELYTEKAGTLDHKGFFRFLTDLPVIKSWSQVFPDDGDFQKHSAEIQVPGVPVGFWVLLATPAKDFSDPDQAFAFTPFWSTQISYISKRNDDGSFAYFLLDRETGMPLKNATAEAWEKNYDYRERRYTSSRLQDFTSDETGYFQIPPPANERHSSSQYLKIHYKNDFLVTDNFYQYPLYKGQEQTTLQTMFYTDRGIYRPGQVVCFKGIMIERTGEKSKIKTNYKTTVVFTDVNGQKISEQNLTTNDFGSVNGSFVAPTSVLPGLMTISNESGSVSVSVEEYKRPTFSVSCDPLEGNYKLGQSLTVTGKAMAYAGNPVDAATVKFRVVRTARFPFRDWGWRWPMPASPEAEITSGTTSTDAEGKFNFSFMAIPDAGVDKKSSPVFDYSVYTDVTDINGETQSAQLGLSVGYKSLMIGTNLTEMVNLANDTLIRITSANLNDRPTPAMVSISLQELRQPDRVFKARSWERPDLHILSPEEFHARFPNDLYDDENNPANWPAEKTVFEKTVNTASDSTISMRDPAFRIPHPGSYLLVLKATDPFGEVVEVKKYFTAFSPVSKEVPVNAISWFAALKKSGEPGETARFLIGSKEDNVNMIYEIRVHDSLVSRELIKLNNRAMQLDIPIREQYRGNFSMNVVCVRHNRVFQYSQVVSVPYTGKKLDIAIEAFRNKLDPGTKETWKIRISNATGKPARAEFLAGMYDASLDVFHPNEWVFNLYQSYSGVMPWSTDNAFRSSSGQWFAQNATNENYLFHPGLKLNWFGINYFGGPAIYSRVFTGAKDKNMRPEMMDSPASASGQTTGMIPPPEMKQQSGNDTLSLTGNAQRPVSTKPAGTIQVRRDFRETAFFYPTLETDSTGSLILEFTAPESLTRWKMLGLAHTKNLDYGLIEKELETSKELMVFPNAPRFLRQGDTIIFSTKIVNLSEHDLSGKAKLELSDAISMQSYNSLIDPLQDAGYGMQDQNFIVKKGQGSVVYWRLFIPVSSGLSVLRYRITAVSGNFSDGEEKDIPVLTNRMLVTESLPLPVRGKGTSVFSFDKLLKSGSPDQKDPSLKNYRLTLEFASNPAWYAIQALPSLNDKQYENADAVFAAYWSNSVAAYIANSNPKIKAVFESWKTLTPDALQSNLAKNQQLKSALLRETPWVMEAISETGRRQKLGLFFDPDNIAANLNENLVNLQKLQLPDGAWTWFAGMPENRYITQNIVTGLGQLSHLGIKAILKEQASREMVLKAIAFLDGEMQKDYENLKKQQAGSLDANHLDGSQVQYLYARSFFMTDPAANIPYPSSAAKEAFTYYQKQAEKYWLQNDRYLQGMIALALNRLGNREVPVMILKSLSEKALHSREMGMYWAGERGFYWYQAPIETQARMIEAFDEISQDKNTVEELKIWLLKQKQTQDWRSPRATLEACYALLVRGTDLLSEEPGVKISLGKEKINSDDLADVKKEAGTGYFQISWSGNEIKPAMGSITVSKSGDGVAWGALYWQYFENLDQITPAATPMKLEKKLFVERNTPSGPVLEPVRGDERPMTVNEKGSPPEGSIRVGDRLIVRVVLTVDRNLEFVHMKDMRAGALEPANTATGSLAKQGGVPSEGLSGYRYQEGLGYYQNSTDVATNFFFDYLPMGTYVFEYGLKINAAGQYSNGITTIQCMYAPEFSAHSEGIRLTIK